MKKMIVQTTARIVGVKEEKTVNDTVYYNYPCELPGGWLDRLMCRQYDNYNVGDIVPVCVQVSPVSKEEVKSCVYIKR